MPLTVIDRHLITMVRETCYKTGNFTLASGQPSDYFIDLKPALLHPDHLRTIAFAAMSRLSMDITWDKYPWAIAGPAIGAIPLAIGLMIEYRREGITCPALIVRKEAKDHGTGQRIDGLQGVNQGDPVLVVEDVVTTGGSTLACVQALREAGLWPVIVMCVVDRLQGGREAIEKEGLQFISLTDIAQIREKK